MLTTLIDIFYVFEAVDIEALFELAIMDNLIGVA